MIKHSSSVAVISNIYFFLWVYGLAWGGCFGPRICELAWLRFHPVCRSESCTLCVLLWGPGWRAALTWGVIVPWWRLESPIRGSWNTDCFLRIRLGTDPVSLLPIGESWIVKSSISGVGSAREGVSAKQ